MEGKASVIAADNSGILGIIGLSDVLRPEAADMLKQLSAMNTKAVLLTGDHRKTAAYFADKVGISEIRADLLPEEKVDCIRELKQNGRVCMIGDGVNDAPALKIADVGVAMGVLNPTTGALVHNVGSCFVVLLAALLYDRKYIPSA